jgi:hypothetical protein
MSEQKDEALRQSKKGALARLLSSIKFLVDPELPVEDRRVAGRVDCQLETGYVTETGEGGVGTVLDISRRGLRMRTDLLLPKGITVALKPPASLNAGDLAPIMARVMWSSKADQGYLSGLLLPPGIEDEETWLEALLIDLGFDAGSSQRRKFVRAETSLPGRLHLDGLPVLEVTVLNLSLGGALLKAEQAFEKSSSFQLGLGPHKDLPELELSGTILRHTPAEGEGRHLHSTRFGPLEERRHTLLKEYIIKLLQKP